MTADIAPLRRALLSVSDKSGLLDLGQALAAQGVELLSTGGTRRALEAGGVATMAAEMRSVVAVPSFLLVVWLIVA